MEPKELRLWAMQSKLSFFFPHQIFFIRLRICFDRGFPGGSVIKNPHANEADADSISGWGRSPGEGNGNPFQFSFLGNHMMVYGPWGGKWVGHYLATKQQRFVPLMVSPLRIQLLLSILSRSFILLKIYVRCHIIAKAVYRVAKILFFFLALLFSYEKARLDDDPSPAYTDDLRKYVFFILPPNHLRLFLAFIYQNLDIPVVVSHLHLIQL